MDEALSKIADSEVEVLKLLWKNGREMTMPEIREALKPATGWNGSTIKTLLYRLCDKGVVAAEKRGVFYYKPLISEQEYNEFATKALIDRLYKGSAKNLVASLIDGEKLSDGDIKELRDMFRVGE